MATKIATTYVNCEVWILIDDEGRYVANSDDGKLNDQYGDDHQDVGEALGLRRVKITSRVPLPTVIEVAANVVADEEVETATA